MADPAVRRPAPPNDPVPRIVEGEVVDLFAPRSLQYPPALRTQVSCLCGKGSITAHGPYSCDEVLAIRARVEFGQRPAPARLVARLRGQAPEGWTR